MTSAFQANSFQLSAFQIAPVNDNGVPVPSNSPYSWDLTRQVRESERQRWIEEQSRIRQAKADATARQKAKQAEIDRLEARRRKDLANSAMQIELRDMLMQMAALDAQMVEIEAEIQRYKQEDDDIVIMLLCLGW